MDTMGDLSLQLQSVAKTLIASTMGIQLRGLKLLNEVEATRVKILERERDIYEYLLKLNSKGRLSNEKLMACQNDLDKFARLDKMYKARAEILEIVGADLKLRVDGFKAILQEATATESFYLSQAHENFILNMLDDQLIQSLDVFFSTWNAILEQEKHEMQHATSG